MKKICWKGEQYEMTRRKNLIRGSSFGVREVFLSCLCGDNLILVVAISLFHGLQCFGGV